ncbi:MAG TPA: glucose-6-phosphate dehydrogenase assembly protein OpcA [Chthoniobacterales bacterium]|nr:glucose-6-phosphate dehydrogenase assembly protein OpcA [Chthoniobacterales bacterium]
MSTTAEPQTNASGLPVEIDNLGRELKKLWEQGGEVMTRASLINLAVYSEDPNSLGENTHIVSEITREHACRAIVIAADPNAATDRADAWISAHCHTSRTGSKQVCSEQLSFALSGCYVRMLANVVFAHLDSDLPLYLWWQGDLPDPIDPQLWTWVERLIYDSALWTNFGKQMRLVETAQAEAHQRVVLCDLNWARLVQTRLAIAQFFDSPAACERLREIDRVQITLAPGHRSTAILLVGWLAAQLGWRKPATFGSTAIHFSDSFDNTIAVALRQAEGETIGACSLFCGTSEYRVEHPTGADLLSVSLYTDGQERMHQLMPTGSNDPVRLMREELMRGGPHRVYLRAVKAVRELI